MVSLEEVTDVSIFAPHVGSRFRIEVGPKQEVMAKLVDADAVCGEGATFAGSSREPFSLLFEVGEGEELPQKTYQVSHDALGTLALFLVPVRPGKMESVFN